MKAKLTLMGLGLIGIIPNCPLGTAKGKVLGIFPYFPGPSSSIHMQSHFYYEVISALLNVRRNG